MKTSLFMNMQEVRKELQCSEAFAYKVIREMNEELGAKGYLVVRGKVPRKYFMEKCYGENKA